MTVHVPAGCDQCGIFDDHPKVHTYTGETYHHDCAPHKVRTTALAGAHSQHPLITAKVFAEADKGCRGDELRDFIAGQQMKDYGDLKMAGGMDQTMSNAILSALLLNSGTATATIGTVTVTYPNHVRFDSVVGTDSGAATEWTTSGGYTAGGVAFTGAAVWSAASAGARASNAAVTVTNAPAQTWAGNEIWDASGTPLRSLWGPLSGGSKTVNSGDTCTIASAALIGSLA